MLLKPTTDSLKIQVKDGEVVGERFLLSDDLENYTPTAIELPLPQNPAPWKDLYGYITVSLMTLPRRIVWK